MNRNKKLMLGLTTLTAAAMLPLSAQAQGGNKGPYVGGGIGYNEVGDQTFDFRGKRTNPTQPTVPVELDLIENSGTAAENEYKGNLFFQAVVGFRAESGLRPEFELSYRQNDADEITFPDPDANAEAGTRARDGASAVKLTQTSAMFNLWYDLFPSSRFHPYFGGGVGVDRFKLNKQPTNLLTAGTPVNSSTDPGDVAPGPPVCLQENCGGPRKSDDARLAYQAGAGIRWDMLDYLTVGLDYRYVKAQKAKFYGFKDQQETHLDSDYDAQSLMVSLNYFFDKPVAPPPPAEPVPVVVLPICSDTLDNDGDGQTDFPNDPGCSAADDGDETDPSICSDGKDNDGDGLIDFPSDKGCSAADDTDEVDPCKTPAPGERISLKGCGLGDVIVLRGVNFEFDQARLTANAKTILDNVGEELATYPEIEVELSGHTDAKGSDEYNQALSDKRAAAVKRYLVGKDIAESRMRTVGMGESQPVADNETDEGRELNRRTELKITKGVAPGGPAATAEAADGSSGAETAPAADLAATDGAVADAPAADAADVAAPGAAESEAVSP